MSNYKDVEIEGSKFCMVERDDELVEIIHYPVEPGVSKRRHFPESDQCAVDIVNAAVDYDNNVKKSLNGNVQSPGALTMPNMVNPVSDQEFDKLLESDLPLQVNDWGRHELTEGEIEALKGGQGMNIGSW